VVHRFSPTGVLLLSAILSAAGLFMLGNYTGNMLFLGAVIFGMGVCYFWPTMLGFVSENLPETGAVGLNLMGGAGMFAVSVYTSFMGGYYDKLLVKHLPEGTAMAQATADQMNEAKKLAGPEVLNLTLLIPVMLIVAFTVLFLYMRKNKPAVNTGV
jgi:MFS family permease